ncbi:hypothetical protein [Dechloromonas sp. A34]|uniref:hypothetical protein n=1 Tax=Dechloromonas sp. A34 TaxID=447588 RepID=UPI002248DD89|nr:hypothetical protein [Dechloromonas sp. A34]
MSFRLLGSIAAGIVLGALSWSLAAIASGHFEPYDSGLGLLANQLVLSVPAGLLALKRGARACLVLVLGSYLGMNLYAFTFGGGEQRAWLSLGMVASLLLIIVPLLVALAVAAYRVRHPSA